MVTETSQTELDLFRDPLRELLDFRLKWHALLGSIPEAYNTSVAKITLRCQNTSQKHVSLLLGRDFGVRSKTPTFKGPEYCSMRSFTPSSHLGWTCRSKRPDEKKLSDHSAQRLNNRPTAHLC